MKNLTLRIHEGVLQKARVIASQQSTSVNELVRDYLNTLVTQDERRRQARQDIISLSRKSKAHIGAARVSRDSLYDR